MKITYEKTNKPYKYLEDLGVGTIFRPKNSQTLYLVTDHTGGDEVFDEDMSTYYAKEDNIQNFDYDDVPPKGHDLVVAVDLLYGNLHFFHHMILVELLDCELIVKEND